MRISRALATIAIFAISVPAWADWPQMLGPMRDGKATGDVPLLDSFPDDGPKIVWKHKVGEGFAGPAVADGNVLIFHRIGNQAKLEALDVKDGSTNWAFGYATNYRDSFGFDGGPRSVPTVAGGRVFTYGAEGMLHCIGLEAGTEQWSVDLAEQYGSQQGFFGRSSAPLAAAGSVIVCAGGDNGGKRSAVFAFDQKTGALKWQAVDDEADYASPVVAKIGTKQVLVCFLRTGLALLDPATGKVFQKERFRAEIHASVNAASPVLLPGDRVFLSSCYDVGAGVWKLQAQADDNVTATSVWKRGEVLDCHYATPVEQQGFLYGFHGRQEMGTVLRCVQASDGEMQWSSNRLPAGSVTLADGKLLVITEKGELLIAKADASQFDILTRGQILGAETRALPAVADGFLYARDKRQLVCVDLRSRGKP